MKNKPVLLSAYELALVLNVSEFTVKMLAKTKQLPCEYIRRRPCFKLDRVLAHFRRLEGGAVC